MVYRPLLLDSIIVFLGGSEMGFLMASNFKVGKTVTWGGEENDFSFVTNTKLEITNNIRQRL